MRLVRTPAAQRGLVDIWSYTAADNLNAEDRLLDAIGDWIANLLAHPRMGRLRSDIASNALCLPIGNYLLPYRIEGQIIQIVRIVPGSRHVTSLF